MSGAKAPAVRADVLGIAAVTYFVDPAQLAEHLDADAGEVTDILFPEVTSERDSAGTPRWVLKPGVRRALLATPAVARFVERAAPAADATERMLRNWLNGELIEPLLALQSDPQATRRVVSWMSDSLWASPSPAEVTAEIARFDLRRSFMQAASSTFVGRHDELRWLAETLSTGERVAALEAKGGMGKSALIAQHLLITDGFRRGGRIALVIDFDDPGLGFHREQTLYVEMARQAAIQASELAPVEQALTLDLEASLRDAFHVKDLEEGIRDIGRSFSVAESLFERLRDLGRPVTIVLDTVERARRIAPKRFARVVDSLRDEVRWSSNLSLLISGRGAFDDLDLPVERRLQLAALDRSSAERLLELRNVPADRIALILDHVPATPLTLRLAARAVEQLGTGLFQEEALLDAVQKARVDGYLQRRLLGHLGSDPLAEVARRALLLRTITPRRLLDIVGPLMNPPIVAQRAAEEMYEKLARVTDLVQAVKPGDVRVVLRPEVVDEFRELALLEDLDLVMAVHQRAVDVLDGKPDPEDIEERQYHVEALAAIAAGAAVVPFGARMSFAQLRDSVLSLTASGLYAEVVALVESHPAARRDAVLLRYGALAARRAEDVRSAESLAAQLVALDPRALVNAEASVIRGWAADRRGEVNIAHAHRRAARAAWDSLDPGVGTPVERATVIAELAVDDPAWARVTLEDIVASAGAFGLRGMDRRLINRVCSLVRSIPLMSWAATVGVFDVPGPENLDLEPLAALVLQLDPSAFRVSNSGIRIGPTIGPRIGITSGSIPSSPNEGAVILLREQRASRLGVIINRVIARGTQVSLPPLVDALALIDALADVLDQLAGESRQTGLVDIQQRVGQFDMLTRMLTAKVDGQTWRAMVETLGDDRVDRRARIADVELAVRGALTEIDRTRHGSSFVNVLAARGYPEEAALADELFVKRTKI